MASEAVCCDVCIEPTKKIIECNACHFKSCQACAVTYFETSSVSPQCMSCHKPMNHQYLREQFGATCLKKILDIHKQQLFDEQMTLLPHTQQYSNLLIEQEKNNNDLKRKYPDLKIMTTKLKKIRKTTKLPLEINERKTLTQEKHNMLQEMNVMKINANRISNDILSYKHNLIGHHQYSSSSTTSSRSETYMRPCGLNECKGYVSDKTKRCKLCETEYCSKCHESKKDSTHECKEEDVLSVSFLKKDSKNCPTCSVTIHRISGCPDMFCVSCKTAFNWNTLKIHTNGNSNPLYYQWIQKERGESGEGCDGHHTLVDVVRCENYRRLTESDKRCVMDAMRAIDHRVSNINEYKQNVKQDDIFRYRYYAPQVERTSERMYIINTAEMRARYLQNKLSENQFKTNLMRLKKGLEYNEQIEGMKTVIDAYRTDMINNIVNNYSFCLQSMLQEFVKFVMYIDKCEEHLYDVYYQATKKQMASRYENKQKNLEDVQRTTPTNYFIDIPQSVRITCTNYLQMIQERAS